MKTILLWDARFPNREPDIFTIDDSLASVLVRCGVAAPVNPSDLAGLIAAGAMIGGPAVASVIQHGIKSDQVARVNLPLAALQVGLALGVAVPVSGPAALAGYNLITAPNDFTAWVATGLVIAADVAVNPISGLINVDRVTQVANTSAHALVTTGTQGQVASGLTYTFAVDAQMETQRFVQLQTTITISSGYANFDLLTGTVTVQGSVASAIVDLGGGWKRISMTVGSASTRESLWSINLINSGTSSRAAVETLASGSEKALLVCNAQAAIGPVANGF